MIFGFICTTYQVKRDNVSLPRSERIAIGLSRMCFQVTRQAFPLQRSSKNAMKDYTEGTFFKTIK